MRFKSLDLNLLVALDVLLEELSVTRAAARLHISQPAMSAALARLREHFGEQLFVMHGKKMVPTTTALQLQQPLRELIGDIDRLMTDLTPFDPATSERHYRIAASDYLMSVIFPSLMQRLQKHAPGIAITVVPQSEHAPQQLDQGDIDLILVPDLYVSPKHPSQLLFVDRHVAVGCASNPLFHQTTLSEDAFYDSPHVCVDIGTRSALSIAESHLRQRGMRRRIELSVPSFLIAPDMVVRTPRITVMHERLATLYKKRLPIASAELPFEFPEVREMAQYHVSRQNDPGLQWLLSELKRASNHK